MIPRKCHIKRIYGKRNGVEDTSTWIDVLRIDELGTVENEGAQVKIFRLKWQDDPTTPGQDTTTNTARQTRTVRINSSDGTVYFEVKAIDRMMTFDSGQRYFRIHKNAEGDTSRTVKRKRVYRINVTLPGEATWQEYVDALTAAGPADTSQYVDVELIEAFGTKQMQEALWQADTHILKLNKELGALQTTSPAETAARLDPFQMVVSVNATSVHWLVMSLSGQIGPSDPTLIEGPLVGPDAPVVPDGVGSVSSYPATRSTSYSTGGPVLLGPGIGSLSPAQQAAIVSQITFSSLPSGTETFPGFGPVITNGSGSFMEELRAENGITLEDFYPLPAASAYLFAPPGSPTFTATPAFDAPSFWATTTATFQLFGRLPTTAFMYRLNDPAWVLGPSYVLISDYEPAAVTNVDYSTVIATWRPGGPDGPALTFRAVATRRTEILFKRTDLIAADGY